MIFRNPRDGAGYDEDNQLVVSPDRGMALSHYVVGKKLTWEDRISTPDWTHEPELEPWPDCPPERIRPHSRLCDQHRDTGTVRS